MKEEIKIGLRIKKFRESQGLKRIEFADRFGIKIDNLYKWEKGTKPSDAEDFLKLEEILKLENIPPPSNLINDTRPPYSKKELENEFLKTRVKDLEKIIQGLEKDVRNLEEKIIQQKKDLPLKKVKSVS